MLRPGVRTASGSGAFWPGGAIKAGPDVHHYAGMSWSCRTFWRFGPGTVLIQDLLRLATDSPQARHYLARKKPAARFPAGCHLRVCVGRL